MGEHRMPLVPRTAGPCRGAPRPGEAGLRIAVRAVGDARVLSVRGELDLATAGLLTAAVRHAVHAASDVRVDLSGVEFVDLAGMRALTAGRAAADDRTTVRIGPLSGPVRRLMAMAGLGLPGENRDVPDLHRPADDGLPRPHVDLDAVGRTVHRLEATLTGGIVTTLQQICDGLVGVFDVSGTGLLFLDDDAVPRYVVASDATGRILEVAQEQLGLGPCVDALVNDEVVVVEDFTTDGRWPRLAEVVVPEGILSMVGIPVELGGGAVGSLNVFRDTPWHWDRSELEALRAFNTLVEHALAAAILAERNEVLVQQLQDALDGRVVIERAVGLLMGRLGVDAVTAFNELRSTARARRVRVRELAGELLADLQG